MLLSLPCIFRLGLYTVKTMKEFNRSYIPHSRLIRDHYKTPAIKIIQWEPEQTCWGRKEDPPSEASRRQRGLDAARLHQLTALEASEHGDQGDFSPSHTPQGRVPPRLTIFYLPSVTRKLTPRPTRRTLTQIWPTGKPLSVLMEDCRSL